MAQTVLFGSDATVTTPTGTGGYYNAFALSITQGIARIIGFGDRWAKKRGTTLDGSVTVSGNLTNGTTNDVLGTSTMSRTGGTLTLTFATSCTLVGVGICTGTGVNVDYMAGQPLSRSYEFTDQPVETWVTS